MAPEVLPGADPSLLLVCDHASNHVPSDIDLGIAAELLDRHIAIDIGADPLTRALAARFAAPAILATVSRLVIDLHRAEDHPALVPPSSDGHAVPGNAAADRADRIARFYAPYHATLDDLRRELQPRLMVAIHSFTPSLESAPGARPWEVGLLYNQDDRAARVAIAQLAAHGLCVGDNEPYSGKLLNATMDRHAEAHGIPYLTIEVRNDLIADAAGVRRWAGILGDTIAHVRNRVAQTDASAT